MATSSFVGTNVQWVQGKSGCTEPIKETEGSNDEKKMCKSPQVCAYVSNCFGIAEFLLNIYLSD